MYIFSMLNVLAPGRVKAVVYILIAHGNLANGDVEGNINNNTPATFLSA